MSELDPIVQAAIVTGIFGLLTLIFGAMLKVLEHTKAARHEVQNSHKTNLRDDLDDLHDDVREVLSVLKTHGAEIGGLRSDLRLERTERLEVARRLDAHIAAHEAA